MPNEENLKKGEPYRFRTGEQQVETARKGGIASGEARRRKKAMRDTAKMLLDMQVPKAAKELKQKLAVMGISEEDFTYQTAVMVGVINQAMKGNTKAAAFLRDTVGENPAHELRERELDQKIAEFEYHRQQEEAQRKESESASSLADAIEEAYRNRMEAEKDTPYIAGHRVCRLSDMAALCNYQEKYHIGDETPSQKESRGIQCWTG